MTAYTTPNAIAAFLGIAVAASWTGQATTVAQAASDWIDAYEGQSWQAVTNPQTENHRLWEDRIWLSRPPVTAIDSVTRKGLLIGAEDVALTADSTYELFDAATGEVLILGTPGDLVTTVYSGATAPPTWIAQAATMLAAHWLGPTLHPESYGLDKIAFTDPGGVSLSFHDFASELGIPSEVWVLLKTNRVPVVA